MRLTTAQFDLMIAGLFAQHTAQDAGRTLEQHADEVYPDSATNFYRVQAWANGIRLAQDWLRPRRPLRNEDDPCIVLYDQLEELVKAAEIVMMEPGSPHDREALHRELGRTSNALHAYIRQMKA